MINVAVLGKRGSGKTTFLLNALAPFKMGILDDIGKNYQYYFHNNEEQKAFSQKLKALSKGCIPEPTIGANEVKLSIGDSDNESKEICLWEIGGSLNFSHTDADFERKLARSFADMVGGRSGVVFDGYIFLEEAQNFGISTGVSFSSFSKRFSEYLALAEKTNKPVLMICTKRSGRSNEQSLYARFQDNFKLRTKAHYAFFDLEQHGKESVLSAKYALTKLLAQSSYIKNIALSNCLYNYFLKLKECIDNNKGIE